jgi:hypothetical protein
VGKLDRGRRFDILRRDGFRCRYCGVQSGEAELHVDHLRPRAEGGTDHPSNLVTACAECNGGKRAKLVEADSPAGWQSLVGRSFSWRSGDGAVAGNGVILADQGHGYYLVEYLAPASKRGHRIAHLSTMHEQDWSLSPTLALTEAVPDGAPPKLRAIGNGVARHSMMRVLQQLEKGEATVSELRAATGLSQPSVSLALTRLEGLGEALRIGKRGQAELWRGGGSEDGSEDAEAGGDGDASRAGAGGAAAAAGGDAGGGAA